MTRSRRGTLVFIIFVGVAGITTATDPPTPGLVFQDAKSILDVTVAQYAVADTYRHTCTWSETAEKDPSSAYSPFGSEEQTSTFLFARPDRFVVITGERELYSDGRWVWEYDPKTKEYTEARAPDEPLTPWSFVERLGTFDLPSMTAFGYLDPGAGPGCPGPDGAGIDEEPAVRYEFVEELRGSTPGFRISSSTETENGTTQSDFWISHLSGAIEQWRGQYFAEHWPGGYGTGEDPVTVLHEVSVDCSEVALDSPISDSAFQFQPGPDDRKVERLSAHTYEPGPPWEERVAPTVDVDEGSLADLEAARLTQVDRFPPTADLHTRPLLRSDVDGDSVPDLLLGGWQGTLTVISGATGESRTVTLVGRASGGSVVDVLPMFLQGEPAWLVQVNHFRAEPRLERSTVALYGPDGKERWVYSPEIPEDLSSEVRLSAGDLDGDGIPEIVVALNLSREEQTGERSWMVHPQKSVLILLDVRGERVLQRVFQSQIVAVHIASPPDRVAGRVVCVFEDGIRLFEIQ